MKFEFGPGQKKLIIGLIFLVVLVTIVVVVVFRRRAKYVYPPTSGSTDETLIISVNGVSTTLPNAIATCTTNYRTALQQGSSDSTPPKNVCIQNAVNAYFTTKCPFVTAGTAPQKPVPSLPPTDAGVVAFNAYIDYTGGTKYDNTTTVSGGGNSGAVTGSSGYIGLGMGTLPNSLTSDIVTRARKADLTGPTRKYIATACPNFYTPADGSIIDYSDTVYKTWSNNPPAASSGVTYGFNGSLVNGPKVYEWAIKAGKAITVTNAISADAAATSTAAANSITLDNAVTIAANKKVKLSGIGGTFTVSSAVNNSTSISLQYDAAAIGGFPAIPVGTTINKYTGSAISTAATSAAAPSALPYTASSATTSLTLTLASALDESIVAGSGTTGSQVLISGAQITGAVYVTSINDANRQSVTIAFISQTPAIPLGATIENILDIPYATPLVTTNLPMYVTTSASTTSATNITLTVNARPTTALSITATNSTTQVTLPSVAIPSGSTIRASMAANGTSLVLTNYNSAASGSGSPTSISWPAIPAGTVIFDANGTPILTASANDLYTKMGTLAGQKMANWQISQTNGPGTVWTSSGANQIQWAYT